MQCAQIVQKRSNVRQKCSNLHKIRYMFGRFSYYVYLCTTN